MDRDKQHQLTVNEHDLREIELEQQQRRRMMIRQSSQKHVKLTSLAFFLITVFIVGYFTLLYTLTKKYIADIKNFVDNQEVLTKRTYLLRYIHLFIFQEIIDGRKIYFKGQEITEFITANIYKNEKKLQDFYQQSFPS